MWEVRKLQDAGFCCQISPWRGQLCFLRRLSESLSLGNRSPQPHLLFCSSPAGCLRRWRLLLSLEHALSLRPLLSPAHVNPPFRSSNPSTQRFDGCESLQTWIDLVFSSRTPTVYVESHMGATSLKSHQHGSISWPRAPGLRATASVMEKDECCQCSQELRGNEIKSV